MDILKQAQALQDRLVSWRRDLHQHPELGFEEEHTATVVAAELRRLGFRVQTGVGRTGVVAELGERGPLIGIRADMDALPIQEENDAPYRSQHPGKMHACGHDAHVAMALGAANLLAESRGSLNGRIRFLFQPSEETNDSEGKSGAYRMIQEGAMEGVSAIFAQHVESDLPAGQIEIVAGPASAFEDTFYATIEGRGSHGAFPHQGLDPIYLANHVIDALYHIVPRRLDPTQAAVISVGTIRAGTAPNVIPDTVEISGTLRSQDPDVRAQLLVELDRVLALTRALGGDYDLSVEPGYPAMLNDVGLAQVVREVATEFVGADKVHTGHAQLGAEDFALFAERAPGMMFFLGVGDGISKRRAHSSTFDIDESALPLGTAILVASLQKMFAVQNDG